LLLKQYDCLNGTFKDPLTRTSNTCKCEGIFLEVISKSVLNLFPSFPILSGGFYLTTEWDHFVLMCIPPKDFVQNHWKNPVIWRMFQGFKCKMAPSFLRNYWGRTALSYIWYIQ
jgi:hypothetical protein